RARGQYECDGAAARRARRRHTGRTGTHRRHAGIHGAGTGPRPAHRAESARYRRSRGPRRSRRVGTRGGRPRSPGRRTAVGRNRQLTITAIVAAVLGAMSLVAYVAIGHLRDQRAALAAEMTALSDQARVARQELANTEASVKTKTAALATLHRKLSEANTDF